MKLNSKKSQSGKSTLKLSRPNKNYDQGFSIVFKCMINTHWKWNFRINHPNNLDNFFSDVRYIA